ncbi:hypothetical protein ACFL02_01915 [Planctomycetota bacterium]
MLKKMVKYGVFILVLPLLNHQASLLVSVVNEPSLPQGTCQLATHAEQNQKKYSPEQLNKIARRFAPLVFQEVDRGTIFHQPRGREDFITAVDFDGDLRGNNNWENLSDYPMLPTVYYSLIETDSHWFISYSFFHPHDWSRSLAPYADHENDMENIQIIVAKNDSPEKETPLLLLTQAHLHSSFAALSTSGVKPKDKVSTSESLVLFDDTGKINPQGVHVGIFIERKGHGIFSLSDSQKIRYEKKNGLIQRLEKKRTATLEWEAFPIIQYVPTSDAASLREPSIQLSKQMKQMIEPNVPFALESIYHRFWAELEKGNLYGEGRLFDGHFAYKDALFDLETIPRHFDSDQYSGPDKKDSGISPFAIGLSLRDPQLGQFFFNPASAYSMFFFFPEPWSTHYLYNPYLTSPLNRKYTNRKKRQDDY